MDLQKTIDDLARRYGTFSFVPHITLYHLGTSLPLHEVLPVIKQCSEDIRPFHLDLEGLFHSDQFTKTLYARYHISNPLQELYDGLIKPFSIHPYELAPHLSLIYKNGMDDDLKKREEKKIKVPLQLRLDRIMVITKKGDTIAKEKDVLEWKVVREFSLI
jgi:hypothetical protein